MGIPTHLILRPSASLRWVNCPGSAWVATVVPSRSNEYTLPGTVAHGYLQACLDQVLVSTCLSDDKGVIPEDVREALKVFPKEEIDLVKQCAGTIKTIADLGGYKIKTEQRLSVVIAGHRIGGTADIILYDDETIFVIDYKHGAGKEVRVEDNLQLMLYGLMALSKAKHPLELKLGILQPRGVGRGLTIWDPDKETIETYRKNFDAAVRRAYSNEPVFSSGPWCGWCAGMKEGLCPAKLQDALEFAVGASDDSPELETLKKLGAKGLQKYAKAEGFDAYRIPWWLMNVSKTASKITSNLETLAKELLKKDKDAVPGWSLLTVPGQRHWTEPSEVADILAELSGLPAERFLNLKEPTPIGITDALKMPELRGKKIEALMSTGNKTVLVPSDSIPETEFDDVE